ncbi:MAG: CatB-related O-acetyltransferase [Alphaproteobacteria bacterium]|nr:MAG: hypothetical protein B6I23_01730 [Rickettsiaceae bacterium 4572_127]
MAKTPFFGYIINEGIDGEGIKHPHIEVGDYSYYAGIYHNQNFEDCVRYSNPNNPKEDKLIMGKYCSVGSGAVFMMSGNQGHRPDWTSTYTFYFSDKFKGGKSGYISKGNTVIGNDVFIGTEAMIMPGIKIGDGAVIGARSVVVKDVPAYTIVGGNPAKELKKRFDDEAIYQLLEIKWWDWSKKVVDENIKLITEKPDLTKLLEITKSLEK